MRAGDMMIMRALPRAAAAGGAVHIDASAVNQKFAEALDQVIRAHKEINALSLSAGGSWGAHGAGFLAGWSRRATDTRPQFQIVTGVSTGAMLAPLVFLGPAYDDALRDEYTTVENQDIFNERWLLALPFSNSLYETSPLRVRVERIVTDEVILNIAREWIENKRLLAVLATNLDSGQSEIFDLTALASNPEQSLAVRRKQVIDAIMASAAIPIAFPPVFINGDMYVDGGVRAHVFLTVQLAAAMFRAGAPNRTTRSQPGEIRITAGDMPADKSLNLFVIVNSDYRASSDCVGNHLLPIAKRVTPIATDQLLVFSVYWLVSSTSNLGWTVKFADARPATERFGCEAVSNNDDIFNKEFMRCLWKAGCNVATLDSDPWQSSVAALPVGPRPAPRALPSIPEHCQLPKI